MADLLNGHWSYPLIASILTWAIGWYAAKFIGSLIRRTTQIDATLTPVLASTARYATLAITALLIFSLLGIDTTNVIVMIGVAGLAIGLALKDTLQNIASGIVLLVLRPFRVGDYIECGSGAGSVQQIHIFATELLTGDGIKVVIPNSALWGGAIRNFTVNGRRRLEIRVGIGYDDDLATGLRVLLDMATGDGRVLSDPAPQAMVAGYGESTVDLMMRCWATTDDFWSVHWDFNHRLKGAIAEAGLSIPFPQRDLHIIPADALPLAAQRPAVPVQSVAGNEAADDA